MASWRERSHTIIDENYREMKATGHDDDVAILAIINRDFYPFGERDMLPYRAWCQAMREWKVKLGIPVPAQKKKRKCGCWFKDGVIETPCEAHKQNWQMTMPPRG